MPSDEEIWTSRLFGRIDGGTLGLVPKTRNGVDHQRWFSPLTLLDTGSPWKTTKLVKGYVSLNLQKLYIGLDASAFLPRKYDGV